MSPRTPRKMPSDALKRAGCRSSSRNLSKSRGNRQQAAKPCATSLTSPHIPSIPLTHPSPRLHLSRPTSRPYLLVHLLAARVAEHGKAQIPEKRNKVENKQLTKRLNGLILRSLMVDGLGTANPFGRLKFWDYRRVENILWWAFEMGGMN